LSEGNGIPPDGTGHSHGGDDRHVLTEPRPAEVRRLPAANAEHERVTRAIAGDREAQRAVLLAHMGRMRRLVTRLVGAGPDVDDLVQSTCVEALASLPRYRGDAPLGLWLDRIATHVVFRFFRTSTRRRARLTLVEDVDRVDSTDHERRAEWREAMRQAREIIESLKAERRIIFLLVAVEGRTVDEAAALLDLTLPAAKSRFLRARREVDKRIAERPALAAALGRDHGDGDPDGEEDASA
jgi:RNA polymerase sigma-70 factor, ECF subfamily